MNIDDIIQKWYSLARGNDVDKSDIFFRFVAVWVAFNALYTSMYSDEIGDWDQVRSFAGDPEAIDRHRKLIQEDEEYRSAVNILKERGVYDVGRGARRSIPDINNLTKVASCLYQVRCNLFHGGKLPGNPRDERLVRAGYIIVSRLIEPFLNQR